MQHVKNRHSHHHLLFLLFCLILLIPSMDAVRRRKPEIVELNDQSFFTFVQQNEQVVVYFYTELCVPCETLEEQLNKLPGELKKIVDHQMLPTYSTKIGKIDVDKNPKTAKMLSIREIPSLKYFHFQEPFEYFLKEIIEENTVEHISQWIHSFYQNRIVEIEDESEIKHLHKPFILYRGNSEQDLLYINYASFELENVKIYWLKDQLQKSMVSYLRKSEQPHTFDGFYHLKELRRWIVQMDESAIIHLNSHENIQKVLHDRLKHALFIILANEADQNNTETLDILEQICEENKMDINCGKVTRNDDMFHGSHDFFDVEETNRSIIGFVKDRMKLGYVYDEEPFNNITESKLRQFVQSARSSLIDHHVDYNIPEEVKLKNVELWDKEKLQQMISKHLYVFVKFFHPNDQRSKAVSLHFDEFAADLDKQGFEVRMGAVDCIEEIEACTSQAIKSYPIMKLYIKGHAEEFIPPTDNPVYPQMLGFVSSKISAKVSRIQNTKQVRRNPAIVFYAKQITEQINIFPKLYDRYPSYFIQTEEETPRMEYRVDDTSETYPGDLKFNIMKNWVNAQKQPYLVNMIIHERALKAFKDKQDVIFFIGGLRNVQFCEDQKLYTRITKQLDKKYNFLGGIVNHEISNIEHFTQFIGIAKSYLRENRMIYYSGKTELKYAYPDSLKNISVESMENFILEVQDNKIKGMKRSEVLKKPLLPDDEDL